MTKDSLYNNIEVKDVDAQYVVISKDGYNNEIADGSSDVHYVSALYSPVRITQLFYSGYEDFLAYAAQALTHAYLNALALIKIYAFGQTLKSDTPNSPIIYLSNSKSTAPPTSLS